MLGELLISKYVCLLYKKWSISICVPLSTPECALSFPEGRSCPYSSLWTQLLVAQSLTHSQ